MESVVLQGPDWQWLDVAAPTRTDLEALAQRFGLPPAVVEDCLDAQHLPKLEPVGDALFVILRAYFDEARGRTYTVQRITRKMAVFLGPGYLLSIHNREVPALEAVKARWMGAEAENCTPALLLNDLLLASARSYQTMLLKAEEQLMDYENCIVEDRVPPDLLKNGFRLRAALAAVRKMLQLHKGIMLNAAPLNTVPSSAHHDLLETQEQMLYLAEAAHVQAGEVINLYVAISGHRTNEVIRLLTLFSVVFMPLTFIAGVYGMNFRHMPELQHPQGYYWVLAVMGLLGSVLLGYFVARGWLKWTDLNPFAVRHHLHRRRRAAHRPEPKTTPELRAAPEPEGQDRATDAQASSPGRHGH